MEVESHVSHLLAAYINNQLDAQAARRVYQHLIKCRTCQTELTLREQIDVDLRRALRISLVPERRKMMKWWRAIRSRRQNSREQRFTLWPAVLSAFLIAVPLALHPDVKDGPSISPVAVPQMLLASTNITVATVATEALDQPVVFTHASLALSPISTTQPDRENAPLAPAPLAPTAP